MELSHHQENEIAVVSIIGNLALDQVDDAKDYLMKVAEDSSVKHLVIDCREIRMMDSNGVGAIVAFYKHLKTREKGYCLFGLNTQNLQILEMLALNQIIPIFKTEADALASL